MKLTYKGNEYVMNASTYGEACEKLGIGDALAVTVGGKPAPCVTPPTRMPRC